MDVEFEAGKERPLDSLQGLKTDFERDGGVSRISESWNWDGWDYPLTLPSN